MNPVTNIQECNERIATLPEFSAKVYSTIKAGLYAEPFFSDIEVVDIAKTLGVSPMAVNASVGHLVEVGLVYTEVWGGNQAPGSAGRCFLHTYEHDEFENY